MEERGVDLRRGGDDLGQRRAQHREHLADLGREHPGLVVVEERRVRAVRPLEALDVLTLELEVRAQVGEKRGEVARAPRLDPGVMASCRLACHLRAKLGRHAPGLLPVAPRHPDEAAIVGVVRELLDERLARIEQAPDLVVDELLVCDPAERRKLLGACLGAARGHRHALVPAEDSRRVPEIGPLGKPDAELVERLHARDPSDVSHGPDRFLSSARHGFYRLSGTGYAALRSPRGASARPSARQRRHDEEGCELLAAHDRFRGRPDLQCRGESAPEPELGPTAGSCPLSGRGPIGSSS